MNKKDNIVLIGMPGAGKSTMLKLLSRVTAPTYGEIDIYGRIASMLEVGTGFNTEMTGRENVYLNGAILGMTKAEIMVTTVGEMNDMVACRMIEAGVAKEKKKRLSFDDALRLR